MKYNLDTGLNSKYEKHQTNSSTKDGIDSNSSNESEENDSACNFHLATPIINGETLIIPYPKKKNPKHSSLWQSLCFYFVIAILICSSPHAADSRIQAELDAPEPIIPLINALGEKKYDEAMASGKYRYVGNTKCRLCHRNFFLGRKKDHHDYAMEKIIEYGYANTPRCLTCHSTGYGINTGFTSMKETPRLANVQCEGCHGPGNIHVSMYSKGGFLIGSDRPDLIKKMCKSCHTKRWNRSFDDFEAAYEKYRNATPK